VETPHGPLHHGVHATVRTMLCLPGVGYIRPLGAYLCVAFRLPAGLVIQYTVTCADLATLVHRAHCCCIAQWVPPSRVDTSSGS
jgi:hypothetical protein